MYVFPLELSLFWISFCRHRIVYLKFGKVYVQIGLYLC